MTIPTKSPRNQIFGYDIPLGHLVLLDFETNRAVLYQHWRRVGNPEDYLAGYWGAPPDVPQGAA